MSCFSGLLTENETWNWLYNGDQLKSTSKCDSRTPRTKKTTKCSHNHQLINVYKYLYNETCEENFFKKNADFNLSFFSLSLQTTTWNHIFKESAGNNDDRNGLSEEVLFFSWDELRQRQVMDKQEGGSDKQQKKYIGCVELYYLLPGFGHPFT